MRLIPILAAATIGLFATAAVAQNMNTHGPEQRARRFAGRQGQGHGPVQGSGPEDGHHGSEQRSGRLGGRQGRGMTSGQATDQAAKANTVDPNSAPGASTNGAGMKKAKHAKHHSKKMKKDM